MSIYVNRVLNMKHIKAIGFDMDHTLVKYRSDRFEELAFHESIKKLTADRNYPDAIKAFTYDFNRAIRGLVVDIENGNVLKVSLYNKIKASYHGTKQLNYKAQQKIYRGSSIDLRDRNYISIDTTFSIAFTLIFTQLVDLKDEKPDLELPTYYQMAQDVLYAVDVAHMDGSLKDKVKANLSDYLVQDPQVVEVLELFKKYGKKLWIVTNSDYDYSKALLDFTITPYLQEHKHWSELFEVVITLSSKPGFFTGSAKFLKIDPKTGLMQNHNEKVLNGIFQGGNGVKLQNDHGLRGDEILYLGDHIYGDILKLKKTCEWRTALVIEEMDKEVIAYKSTKDISILIDKLMEEKIALEKEIDFLYAEEFERGKKVEKNDLMAKFDQIEDIDKQLAGHIKNYEQHFNPYWGEVMRAGVEPSFFAAQIERYACVYMSSIRDFKEYGPRTYFRPHKRKLAHEF